MAASDHDPGQREVGRRAGPGRRTPRPRRSRAPAGRSEVGGARPGRPARRQERGQEAGPEEEHRGRQGAAGAVVDQHREGDEPHPVAQLVDRVGGGQPPEERPTQGGHQSRATHRWSQVLLDFCTSFPADAQVSAKLCYKVRRQLWRFPCTGNNFLGFDERNWHGLAQVDLPKIEPQWRFNKISKERFPVTGGALSVHEDSLSQAECLQGRARRPPATLYSAAGRAVEAA